MKKAQIITALSIFLLLASCATKKMTSEWRPVVTVDKSEPVARHEAAFVKVGDKMYLLGGRSIRPVSIYDPKSQRWTTGAMPPIEIHHFQPVVYDNKIYILGAFTGGYPGETPIENIMIYDPANDTWSKGPEIPAERRRGAAGVSIYEDKIFMSCGIKNGHIDDHKQWLDSYDPKTNTWAILSDAPRPRDHFQSAVAEGKLYVMGGRRSNAPDNVFNLTIGEVDVYDFASNKWETLPNNMPTLRAGTMAVKVNDEILVIGGESGTQELAHSEVEALDIHEHTWRSWPPLIQGRHGTSAVLSDGNICLASGCGKRGGTPELTTMECFTVVAQ
jgi:N-acetylneuraminic acid mutarotase